MGTRKLDRERQILDVAADLFRQRGYQGMRMDDVAGIFCDLTLTALRTGDGGPAATRPAGREPAGRR